MTKSMIQRFFRLAAGGCLLMLLAGCAGTGFHGGSCNVAVWDIEDLSTGNTAMKDIGPLMSARVVEVIQSRGDCHVVERQKLILVMEELNLGSSELADTATRLKVGRIAGAEKMVFGAYQVFGNTMRIDLRLVDVASGEIIGTAAENARSTEVAQWLEAAGTAAGRLIK